MAQKSLSKFTALTIAAFAFAIVGQASIDNHRLLAQDASASKSGVKEPSESLQQAIDSLASPTAAERQQAFQVLVQGAEQSITLLQQAATTAEIDVAESCVGVLFRIAIQSRAESNQANAKDSNQASTTLQQVIKALTEIADDQDAQATLSAKRAVRELTITDLERATKALKATGARFNPTRDNKVYSIQLNSDRQLQWVHYLPHLRYLSFNGPGVTNACLGNLSGLKSIQSISFSNTQISDDGVRHLLALPQLTSVSLAGDDLTEVAIGYLSKLPRLNRVSWGGVTDEISLDALAEIPRLQSLVLNQVTWTDQIATKLNAMTNVTSVQLTLSNLTNDHCQILAETAKDLKLFIKQSDQITAPGWQAIGKLSLTSLFLMQTSIDDDSIALLGKQPKLTSISVLESELTDEGLKHLAQMTSLRYAYFVGTKITSDGVDQLSMEVPTLRRVSGDVNLQIKRP